MSAQRTFRLIAKFAAVLFLGFVLLLLGRFVMGYFVEFEKPVPRTQPRVYADSSFEKIAYRMSCANNISQIDWQAGQFEGAQISLAQINALEVYTREAQLAAVTGNFDSDVEAVLGAVEKNEAIVRLERNRGVTPNRVLRIVIRVSASKFDACVDDLRKIGATRHLSVVKEDQSEQAKQKFAERASLGEFRDALEKLRESEGDVSDRVELEAKIQEVQQKIQKLDVGLGEFVQEESYSNIQYTLTERIEFFVDETESPLSARFVEAFVWSCAVYFQLLAVLFVLAAVILSVWTLRR